MFRIGADSSSYFDQSNPFDHGLLCNKRERKKGQTIIKEKEDLFKQKEIFILNIFLKEQKEIYLKTFLSIKNTQLIIFL